MQFTIAALAALAVMPAAFAQTYTTCNPLNTTCDPDKALSASSFYSDFTLGASGASGWSAETGTTLTYGTKGAEFTIKTEGQAPTIETDFYMLFGTVEVKMQAAPGVGIVSSIVLESDDLDEIDWEFLGGNLAQAETNYFGKGDTSTYDRATYCAVSNPQSSMHVYKVDWSSERLIYYIDGVAVRTLTYAAASSGTRYPQTPMKVKLGSWAGGASTSPAGTVAWAGGSTDFTKAPFTMYVEYVKIENTNPGSEYSWTDKTGSYTSIKVINGTDSTNKAVSSISSSAATSTSTSGSQTTTQTKTSSSTAVVTPALRNTNSSSTLTTSASTSTKTTASSGSKSNTSAAATTSPISSTSSASSNTVATGFVALFSVCMCLVML